jgi:hypothetical protein
MIINLVLSFSQSIIRLLIQNRELAVRIKKLLPSSAISLVKIVLTTNSHVDIGRKQILKKYSIPKVTLSSNPDLENKLNYVSIFSGKSGLCDYNMLLLDSENLNFYSTDSDEYFIHSLRLREKQISPVSQLEEPSQATIFSIGNSIENLPTLESLFKTTKYIRNVVLQLHEADLGYLLSLYFGNEFSSYLFRETYGLEANFNWNQQQTDNLIKEGLLGISVLLKIVEVKKLVVSTPYAKKLLITDLERGGLSIEEFQISLFAHPSYTSGIHWRPRIRLNDDPIRIGILGSLGDGKNLTKVQDFFEKTLAEDDIEIVFLGYDPEGYFKKVLKKRQKRVKIVHYSPIDHNDFYIEMTKLELGIILREFHRGEASGALALARACGVPRVVEFDLLDNKCCDFETGIDSHSSSFYLDLHEKIKYLLALPGIEGHDALNTPSLRIADLVWDF